MSATIIPGRGTPYQRALTARTRRPDAHPPADPEAAAASRRRALMIGSRIRQAHERLGLSQTRLALQVDITRECLSGWERGEHTPSALHLEQLAEALGEPLSYFYGAPSGHPLPREQDPDPYAQPPVGPAQALPAVLELLQVLDRVGVLLDKLGRAGELVDARVGVLRALGFIPDA